MDNYDDSQYYALYHSKKVKEQYQTISPQSCGYYGYIELTLDAVWYWINLVENGKVWSIYSTLSLFLSIWASVPRQHHTLHICLILCMVSST